MKKLNIISIITKPFKKAISKLVKKIRDYFYEPIERFEKREKGYESRKELERIRCEENGCKNMKEYFQKMCSFDTSLDFEDIYTRWTALEARFANGRLNMQLYKERFNRWFN